MLLASGDQEAQSVVALCTNSPYCSLQFVAHIFDVLRGHPSAQRVISRPLAHYGVDQSELFTLNYAETLLGHVDTWLLAAEYLAWCPVNGAAVMEAMLDKSPVSDLTLSADMHKLSSCASCCQACMVSGTVGACVSARNVTESCMYCSAAYSHERQHSEYPLHATNDLRQYRCCCSSLFKMSVQP